jgi:alkanesulfonate monooxygenase SsuD/methylene tetrahydromethanopterin reductase-like flavin-dependent oxidoreductase (luciferase family)
VRAWTEPGPFAFEGKYYQFNYVNSWPRPYQQPHPPIWIPSQGSRETIEWASDPSRKYTYLQTFSPASALARFMNLYKKTAERYGYHASAAQLGWSVPIYVADTDEQAYSQAKPHIENFVNKFLRMPPEMLLPPGYLSLQSLKGVMKAKGAITGTPLTIDDLLQKGMFLCGSPESLRQRLEEYQKQIGFGYLLPLLQFATLPHDLTRRSMELFARKVMPSLRPLGEARQQAQVTN